MKRFFVIAACLMPAMVMGIASSIGLDAKRVPRMVFVAHRSR